MPRKAKINRNTKETNILVEANLDGKGSYKIDTKIGFLIDFTIGVVYFIN